jgi:hypothetical protein
MAAGARVLHLHSARLWQGYSEALTSHPISTKALTCATAYAVGDTIAQLSSTRQHSLPRRLLALDAVRTARLAMFGLLWTGPTGHVFYSWLERVRLLFSVRGSRSVLHDAVLCVIRVHCGYAQLAWGS